jgi:hypothetical protein
MTAGFLLDDIITKTLKIRKESSLNLGSGRFTEKRLTEVVV